MNLNELDWRHDLILLCQINRLKVTIKHGIMKERNLYYAAPEVVFVEILAETGFCGSGVEPGKVETGEEGDGL